MNGVKFLVEQRDIRLATQNSGVLVPKDNGQNFYGVLQEVIELCYLKDCTVLMFKCKWFKTDIDPKKKRIIEDNKFTSVYIGEEWYKNDPFILASQAKSIYYLNDDKNGPLWKLVQTYTPRNLWDFPNVEEANEVEASMDVHIVQEANSQPFQLVVELPQLENLVIQRDDIEAIEINNVDHLHGNHVRGIDDFIVDDEDIEDEDIEDDTLEEYDEDFKSDDSSDNEKTIHYLSK